ncbi:hypothetical protein SAMN05216330_10176 [Bradyrhizobium sp. Ghvi]|nr:hypothetical protein SAMN05216330_10176 [Bradyrhizobium sp. Ghvi]
MPGPVPPARPKPLRRGEGPGIHVYPATPQCVDGRDKPGHDGVPGHTGPRKKSPHFLVISASSG